MLLALMLTQDLGSISSYLGDVTKSTSFKYALKDDQGRGMDCLKAVEIGGKFYGVYHHMNENVFTLYLAESSDLMNWKSVVKLDEHAHQGTVYESPQGIILAFEKDGPDGNWIRMRRYASLSQLVESKPDKEFDVPRKLSKFAEGTPNIYAISPSAIAVGFHFYRDGDVDRQAVGTLHNWTDWSCYDDKGSYSDLEKTYKGNIGDRDDFVYRGENYRIMEAQIGKNDWSSWRLLIREGWHGEFKPLPIKTHKKSTSFANPNVTVLKDGRVFVSLFLPSQGNHAEESGQLVYVLPKRISNAE